ncbi:hypothetical protein EJB05_15615, partial [Eragrostis curvula]
MVMARARRAILRAVREAGVTEEDDRISRDQFCCLSHAEDELERWKARWRSCNAIAGTEKEKERLAGSYAVANVHLRGMPDAVNSVSVSGLFENASLDEWVTNESTIAGEVVIGDGSDNMAKIFVLRVYRLK